MVMVAGFIHDSQGNPVGDIQIDVSSVDASTGQALYSRRKSDSTGKFKVPVFPGDYSLYLTGRLSNSSDLTGVIGSANKSIDITVPAERFVKFRAVTALGLPIAGCEVAISDRSFGNGFYVDSNSDIARNFTDQDGISTVRTFAGGSAQGTPDRAASVVCRPAEDSDLVTFFSESELSDGDISPILENISTAEITRVSNLTPTVLQFNVKVFEPDGLPSISPSQFIIARVGIAAVRDKFKRVDLMKRYFNKGKWTPWTRGARAAVAVNGNVKVSLIKLPKGKYQFRVAGVGYSLGSLVKTFVVK